MAFFLPALLALQITPTPKLPPANPLPYQDPDAAAVMTPVNALLAAITARDGTAVLAQVRPEGSLTAAIEQPDGSHTIRHLSWAEDAASLKPGPEHYEEILSDPAIEVDGDIAMVWAPYVFRINGVVKHCGVDHFDLVRAQGSWKILNVTWSQRTACGQ